MGKPPRLERVRTIDLPVVEASGLATRRTAEGVRVIVVGDRSTRIAAADVGPAGIPERWETLDLADLASWPNLGESSQFEAVATDGGHLVALLREDPATVFVADARERTLRARVVLSAPEDSPLHGHWLDTPNSRGEGLVLLRGGRLLVAKEKDPAALVEFCPRDTPPRGLRADDFLDPGESWDPPAGDVEFVARSMWRLKKPARKQLRDVSALCVGGDRSLWLLSDESEALGRLRLDSPLPPGRGEIRRLDDLWRLPKKAEKPEGVTLLDDSHFLVALDTDSRTANGIVVARP